MSKTKKLICEEKPKRGRGRPATGHKLSGTDETFKRTFPEENPRIEKIPPPNIDPELSLPIPRDKASRHQYPPPKKNPVFRERWMQFIDNVTSRENFKIGHLNTLSILCDCYVDYDELQAFIRTRGRSYQAFGRAGMVWRFYPEVGYLNTVKNQILHYSKILGLILKKDHSPESGGEGEEWK